MYHFGEPGELALYDATNGWQYLGFVKDFSVAEKAKTLTSIDLSVRRYDTEIKVSGVVLRGDAITLNALRAREAIAQTLYFTGLKSRGIVSNVFIIAEQKRQDGSGGKLHELHISGTINDPDNSVRIYNLLDGYGNFNTDSNTDGLADGWLQSALTAKSIEASFLSGRGNAQRIKTTNAAGQIYYDVTLPFNDIRLFTFSVSVFANNPPLAINVHYYRLQIQFKTATAVVDIFNKSFVVPDGDILRSVYTLKYQPPQQITTVRVSLLYDTPGAAELVLDDAQLELNGYVTAYLDK